MREFIVKIFIFAVFIAGGVFFFSSDAKALAGISVSATADANYGLSARVNVDATAFIDDYKNTYGVPNPPAPADRIDGNIKIYCGNQGSPNLNLNLAPFPDTYSYTCNYSTFGNPYNISVEVAISTVDPISVEGQTGSDTVTVPKLPTMSMSAQPSGPTSVTAGSSQTYSTSFNWAGVNARWRLALYRNGVEIQTTGEVASTNNNGSFAETHNASFNNFLDDGAAYQVCADATATNGFTSLDAAKIQCKAITVGTSNVSLSANPTSLDTGQSTTMSWSSSNVNNCKAAVVSAPATVSGWTSGSSKSDSSAGQAVGPFGTEGSYTFRLDCKSTLASNNPFIKSALAAVGDDVVSNTVTVNAAAPVPEPDLRVVSDSKSPSNPTSGQTVTFTGNVRNSGDLDAGPSTTRFRIDGVAFNIQSTGSLSPGASESETSSGWVATIGTHTVRICADDNNDVAESNETNNCRNSNFSVGPDLIVDSPIILSPANPIPGDIITFTGVVRNNGNEDAGPSTTLFKLDGVNFDTQSTGLLTPAGTESETSISWTGTLGSHTIEVCADDGDSVVEADETNNCTTTPFTVTVPGVELTVDDPVAFSPAAPTAGDTITFTATVRNIGDTNAPSSSVTRFRIDGANIIRRTTSALASGASETETRTWVSTAGNHNVEACADIDGVITEYDETNNCVTTAFSVAAPNVQPTGGCGGGHNIITNGDHLHTGAWVYDADGDPLTLQWDFVSDLYCASSPCPTIFDSDTLEPWFIPPVGGDYRLHFKVTDGITSPINFYCTETASGGGGILHSPLVDAGPVHSITTGVSHTHLGASTTDPDGDPLTYNWLWLSCPTSPTCPPISDSTTLVPTYIPNVDGDYTLRFRVADNTASANTTDVIIETASAAPPTLTVDLTASQTSGPWTNTLNGNEPYDGIELQADVDGTAVGTINYYFYCNEPDPGTAIIPGWDDQYTAVSNDPQFSITDLCNYNTAGTYTAKVIAERDTLAAQDQVTITVDPPLNNLPTATGHSTTAGPACTTPLQPNLSWTFSDLDAGDTQLAYQIQVTTTSGVWTAPDLIIDTGKVLSSSNSYTIPSGQLNFNDTYYWRIQVWDNPADETGGYTNGPSFSTLVHAGPNPDFTWGPTSPTVNQFVNFTDLTTFPPGGSAVAYSWTFQDGNPATATIQNPTTRFGPEGTKSVDLAITDDLGTICSITKFVDVGLALPDFQEIRP